MTGLVLLALAAAAAAWWHHQTRRQPGAGASADARARQLRTPLVRLATLLGVSTRAESLAARSAKGAEGERRTARLLNDLAREGWTVRHDLAVPGSNANIDHLVISRTGTPIVVDSKQWDRRWTVRARRGRLMHGTHDVTDRLRGVVHEATAVAGVLGVQVLPLVVVHGAPVHLDCQVVDGIRIVPASRACEILRALGRRSGRRTHAHLTEIAATHLPPHGRTVR